jgi:hypothetical protein
MFFEVEHIFDAPVEAVEAAMFHPDYYAFLQQQKDVLDGVSPEAQEDSGSQIKRRVHYKPRPAFDHIGPKKVPAHWFEFIEESTWDKATRKLVFDNVPITDKVARRFVNHGEILLERLSPERTRRRARAELRLHNLPLMLRPLAGLAEQMIAREAKKLIENEARALGEFLEAGKSVRPPAETAV